MLFVKGSSLVFYKSAPAAKALPHPGGSRMDRRPGGKLRPLKASLLGLGDGKRE